RRRRAAPAASSADRGGSRRSGSWAERETRERHHALGIGPLAVPVQIAARAAEDAEGGVDRRVAADAAAVAVARDRVEERAGIAVLHRAQHLAVLALDPGQLVGRD